MACTENPFPGPLDCNIFTSPLEPPQDCIISNPMFAMKFSYQTPNGSYSGATPQYNGNISQIEQQLLQKHIEGFNYQYDALDRLLEQDYWWRSCDDNFWNNKFYNVEDISYDLNGNMKTIKRHTRPFQLCDPDQGIIDNLNMSYSGNQLVSVSDGSTLEPEMGYILGDYDGGYGYDPNGNMTTIGNKPFTLGYNYLNLPSTKGLGEAGSVQNPAWTYTADGQKLKYENRDYVDGIEYQDGKLYAIHHAEGRIYPKEQTAAEINNNTPQEWQYQYYLRDHLGNTRIVIDEGGNPIQENNYYPFGMNMENIDLVEDNEDRDSRFLYNGKEMNKDLGWLDYGARFYDPSIGRFSSVDLLSESIPSWSPYHYVFNNPISFNDPTGMMGENAITTWVRNEKTNEVFYVDDGYSSVYIEVSDDDFNTIKNGNGKQIPWFDLQGSYYLDWAYQATLEELSSIDNSIFNALGGDGVEDGLRELGNGNIAKASLALFLARVKGKEAKALVEKLYKTTTTKKMPTPELNPGDFIKRAGKWIHKKTKAIYSKSHTSHGNKDNVGTQWKAWPKGQKNFGSNSKNNRITIDGEGDVIGN